MTITNRVVAVIWTKRGGSRRMPEIELHMSGHVWVWFRVQVTQPGEQELGRSRNDGSFAVERCVQHVYVSLIMF
jgi:hypothetical protein